MGGGRASAGFEAEGEGGCQGGRLSTLLLYAFIQYIYFLSTRRDVLKMMVYRYR